jgi:hypothetical protein
MKSIFIVLLIAAVGAGVYFYFSKKQQGNSYNSKELILGKWKMDSLVAAMKPVPLLKSNGNSTRADDSSMKNFEFEFRKDSLVIQTFDKAIRDTSHYAFADEKRLLVWHRRDSVKSKFLIANIDSDNMTLLDKDSAAFYFRRTNDQ